MVRTLQLPLSLQPNSVLSFGVVMDLTPKGASAMEWVTPQHEEIDLQCEVSSYAKGALVRLTAVSGHL